MNNKNTPPTTPKTIANSAKSTVNTKLEAKKQSPAQQKKVLSPASKTKPQ